MGLEVSFQGDEAKVHYCILGLKGKSVQIIKSATNLKLDDFMTHHLDPAIPIAVVFTGKGIIHKKVSFNPTDDLKSLLNKTLPNIHEDEFYLSHSEEFNSTCVTGVCRKILADEVIQLFQEKKADVISFSIGPFSIKSILPLISQLYETEVSITGYKLKFTDGQLNDLQTGTQETKSYHIGGEQIESNVLIAFSAAFSILISLGITGLSNIQNTTLIENYKQKRMFKTGLGLAVGFIFVLVFINYFVFSHYSAKVQKIQSSINLNQSALSQIDTLKKEIEEKEKMVIKSGLLQSSRTSYYADQIASTVPENVRLTGIMIFPKQKSEDETLYNFKNDLIEIQGKCKYSIDVNDWINEMRMFSWAKEIKLIHYNPSNSEKGSDFNIQITI